MIRTAATIGTIVLSLAITIGVVAYAASSSWVGATTCETSRAAGVPKSSRRP